MNSQTLDASLEWLVVASRAFAEGLLWGVPWSLLFGAIGFIISIVVVVTAFKKRLLKRDNRIWNIAAKAWYPVVILTFTMAGCAGGMAFGVNRNINLVIEDKVRPVLEKNMPTLHEYLISNLEAEPGNNVTVDQAVGQILQKLYYQSGSDGFMHRGFARSVNWFTLNFGKWLVAAAVGAIVAYAVGRTGDTLGLSKETVEFTVDTIKEMDFSRVDGTIVKITLDALYTRIDDLFLSFYFTLFIWVIATVALIAAEIFVYRRYFSER